MNGPTQQHGAKARVFANPAVVAAGWYPTVRARKLRKGKVLPFRLGPHTLALYRRPDGTAHALDARCAHLGADLTQGTVQPDGLRCPYHGWCWGDGGRLEHGPPGAAGRCAPSFPVEERWGLLWVWVGPSPAPPLHRTVHPRPFGPIPFKMPCHPHLVLANGLDDQHYRTLHGLDLDSGCPVVTHAEGVTLELRGTLTRTWMARLLGLAGARVEGEYGTRGASLAWLELRAPLRMSVVFAGGATADGAFKGCSLVFVPRRRNLPRALALLALVTANDTAMLSRLRFQPNFVAEDRGLRAYAAYVEGLPAW